MLLGVLPCVYDDDPGISQNQRPRASHVVLTVSIVLPEMTSLNMAVLDVPSLISEIATPTLIRNGPSVIVPSVVR